VANGNASIVLQDVNLPKLGKSFCNPRTNVVFARHVDSESESLASLRRQFVGNLFR
jgi:hypothetical protein